MLVFCRLSHVNALIMHINHNKILDGVILTPLKKIGHPKGDVFHAMKSSDEGFCGFGEAYFSVVSHNAIKAWKRHHEMTLNLVVPVGKIRFVLFESKLFVGSS